MRHKPLVPGDKWTFSHMARYLPLSFLSQFLSITQDPFNCIISGNESINKITVPAVPSPRLPRLPQTLSFYWETEAGH